MQKLQSVGYCAPPVGHTHSMNDISNDRFGLYRQERDTLKEAFKSFGNVFDWGDPGIKDKLQEFAQIVVKTTQQTVLGTDDLTGLVLPVETVAPGDTFKSRDIHGVAVYYGSYGGTVRMSRPQFTEYSQATDKKEVGLKLELAHIRTGKYSPSELADYTSNLVIAWRNHLVFTTTLAGATEYSTGGAQYTAGTILSSSKMETAINTITDEGDIKMIIGRRQAVHALSHISGYSNETKREFETQGQVGTYAGIPVMKVNSFTDPDYGTVYPMVASDLWIVSELPAGAMVVADALRTDSEIIPSNETMNIYFRWDDGVGIWKTNRIARVGGVTSS